MRQERFTEQAWDAIVTSQRLVGEFQHNQWDTEHILLALLMQERGLVGDILRDLGVDVDAVRQQVEKALEKMPRVSYSTGQIYATPRIQALFQTAEQEAKRLQDELIATEHLLIAMTAEAVSYTHLTLPTN